MALGVDKFVDMENGQQWGISIWPSIPGATAEIVVPVDDLESMTDEQIGRYVRSLVDTALDLKEATVWDSTLECRGAGSRYDLNPTDFKGRKWAALNKAERKQWTIAHRRELQRNRAAVFLTLMKKQGLICAHCGRATEHLDIDHIHPLAKGGDNQISNLQLLCGSCNSKKKDRMPAGTTVQTSA